MTNKKVSYAALALFAMGLGFGASSAVMASPGSSCLQSCRSDHTECVQNCGANPTSACKATCDSIYNNCRSSCG